MIHEKTAISCKFALLFGDLQLFSSIQTLQKHETRGMQVLRSISERPASDQRLFDLCLLGFLAAEAGAGSGAPHRLTSVLNGVAPPCGCAACLGNERERVQYDHYINGRVIYERFLI